MKLSRLLAPLTLSVLATVPSFAGMIHFDFYVDDRGTVNIDGNLFGSYNNPASAGNIIGDLNLTPGWHDISIAYANQAGTNFLALRWSFPGDLNITDIPRADLRSLNQNSQFISGLRADYYSSWGGSYLFTVFGEGPIDNGAVSFTLEKYQGVTGALWAGFGPSSQFSEVLNGQFFVPAPAPEPSSALLGGVGALLMLIGYRRSRVIRQRV